jgi:hypothetical protein
MAFFQPPPPLHAPSGAPVASTNRRIRRHAGESSEARLRAIVRAATKAKAADTEARPVEAACFHELPDGAFTAGPPQAHSSVRLHPLLVKAALEAMSAIGLEDSLIEPRARSWVEDSSPSSEQVLSALGEGHGTAAGSQPSISRTSSGQWVGTPTVSDEFGELELTEELLSATSA